MSRRQPRRTAFVTVLATASLGLVALATAPMASAAPLTPGDVLVVRVGDGAGTLSAAAAPVAVQELGADGALVQSIALPAAAAGGQRALTMAGSATGEGALAVSPAGHVTLAGYDAAPGTAAVAGTAAATVNRTIARISPDGTVDTSTALTDAPSGGSIRGAVTDDGSRFWTAGANGGVRFAPLGGSTSTQLAAAPANVRVPVIANGQLYVSAASTPFIGVAQVGTGLPTTPGQTAALLAPAPSAYGFSLLDRDPAVPGVDTLYVADDSASPNGGVLKFSSDGTAWTARGSYRPAGQGVRGLASRTAPDGSAQLVATTAAGGGQVVSLTDSAPSAAPIAVAATTVLRSAEAGTAFRGVAFVPGSAPVSPAAITTQPADVTIAPGATATLTVGATGTAPLSYQWFQGLAGDTSTPVGTNAPTFTSPALTAGTSYWVRVTNAQGSADSRTAVVTVEAPPEACTGPALRIGEVQGSTDVSPLAGASVKVRGVVVGDYEGAQPALRGFYLQDAAGTSDGDPATSDAVFVFDNGADLVSNGQLVEVIGSVSEFQGQTQITAGAAVSVCGQGTAAPTDLALPLASPTALEPYEGMLVRFPQSLTVTEHFQLGRFGQVVVSSGGRLRQPTNLYPAADPRTAQLTAANALNRLIVDDATNGQNPDPIVFGRGGQPLSATNTLRGGDTLTGSVGVLTYTWAGNAASGNAYRLRPVGALGGSAQFTAVNARPTTAPAVGGTLTVASANMLNYFNTFTGCSFGTTGGPADCRGANSATEFERQAAKEVAVIGALNPDVLGIMEIENDGYGPDSAIQDLVNRLNAATAPGTWAFVNPDAATGTVDVAGSDAIKVGLLYKPAKVTPVAGATRVDVNAVYERRPLAQTFQTPAGARLSVVVNHFKSKGSCPATGPDTDQGDGQSCWNARRVTQAQALAAFVTGTVVPAAQDPDVLIVGDLNSYAKEDPILALQAAGFANLVEAFGGPDAYSYAFDGQWGYLDHALASASLRPQVTGSADHHVNADEPAVLDYNVEFKTPAQVASLYAPDQYRTSDHDPILTGIAPVVDGASTTVVTSSLNPSRIVQPVRFTATVTPASPWLPVGGTVRFYAAGVALTGPIPVSAAGTAVSPQLRFLLPGTVQIEARYSGAGPVRASTGRITQRVRLF